MKRSTLFRITLLVVAALALVASTGCYMYPAPQPTAPQIIAPAQPVTFPDPGKPGPAQPPDPARPGFSQPPEPGKPGVDQPPEPIKPGFSQPLDPMRPGPGQPPDIKPSPDMRPDSVSPNMGQPPEPRMIGDPLLRKGPAGEPSVSFAASRTNLQAGECATLNWNIQGEGAFWIELDAQRVDRTGQKQVCPQQTQLYNLHVDLGERVERREVVINVENTAQQSAGQNTQQQNSQGSQSSQNLGTSQTSSSSQNSGNSNSTSQNPGNSSSGCPGAPTFSSFTASKSTITLGDSVTLSWGGVTNGNSSVLVKSVILSDVGEVGSPGSRSVKPSAEGTATYTLTATGCGGTASKSVSVTVQKSNGGGLKIVQFDLQLSDIYTNGAGQVLAKIKNNGPDTAQPTGTLTCSGYGITSNGKIMPTSGTPISFKANLKAGETMEVFTGITRSTDMVLTCKMEAGSILLGDNTNNNEVTKKLK